MASLLIGTYLLLAIMSIGFAGALMNGNSSPIIGILTKPHPTNSTLEFVEKRYINFIESSGGRVIPISYKLSQTQLLSIFNKINGIIFPGGGSDLLEYDSQGKPIDLSPYSKTAKILVSLAIQANNNGDYFPIYGICMGFEVMNLVVADDLNIFTYLNHSTTGNMLASLEFITSQNRLYSLFPDDYLNMLKTKKITPNMHKRSILNSTFYQTPGLTSFFNLLTLSNNSDDTAVFLSSVEAINYPFYGVQYHMEKANYLFDPKLAIIHEYDTVRMSEILGNFFISETRKNTHQFSSFEEEKKYSIYNYPLKLYDLEYSFEIDFQTSDIYSSLATQ